MKKGYQKFESPKRLPSRGGVRIGETSIRKAKNSSGTGIMNPQGNGQSGNSTEDYAPTTMTAGSKIKATFYNGRMIGKEEFAKDFAEISSATTNLKSAGSGVMDEFRKTRRFASKTSGPWHFHINKDERAPCAGHFDDTHSGPTYTYMPNQRMIRILQKSEDINKQYS